MGSHNFSNLRNPSDYAGDRLERFIRDLLNALSGSGLFVYLLQEAKTLGGLFGRLFINDFHDNLGELFYELLWAPFRSVCHCMLNRFGCCFGGYRTFNLCGLGTIPADTGGLTVGDMVITLVQLPDVTW